MPKGKVVPQFKLDYIERVRDLLRRYSKVMIVSAENVNATQLLRIRHDLTGTAEILFGKNSLMRRAISEHQKENPTVAALSELVCKGVGMVFTNSSFSAIKEIIDKHCVGSPAKVGAISPVDVMIYPQHTTLAPTQVSVLHALNIQSKIFKGTIEITSETMLIKKGDKVGASESNLLQLLNILPFRYTLRISKLYDNGNIYEPSILEINNDVLGAKFSEGLRRVAGLALGIGYPCAASAQHMVAFAFKNVAAVAVSIGHEMKQIADLQKLLADPAALERARAAAAPKEEKKAEKKEEKKEEEVKMDLGFTDIFG